MASSEGERKQTQGGADGGHEDRDESFHRALHDSLGEGDALDAHEVVVVVDEQDAIADRDAK